MRTTIRYVVEDMDRHGNVRVYFRRAGFPKVRLPGKIGSPEFWAAYNAALATSNNAVTASVQKKTEAVTMRGLVENYYKSAAYQQNGARTQHVRKLVLDRFCNKHGHRLVGEVEPKHLKAIRNEMVATPEAANDLLKYLRQVFKAGIDSELCKSNPAVDVGKLKSRGDGHHSWTPEEVEQFEATHPVGTKARLALALLLYTAQRRSDVVEYSKRQVRAGFMEWRGEKRVRVNWLHFTQKKNEENVPVHMDLPIIPPLQDIIDSSPIGDETFLVTSFGKKFTSNGFGNKFREWCDAANLKHCSAHGLRKAACARLAELGCTDHEIMAITGHKSLSEVQRYTRGARRYRLAASGFARMSAAPNGPDE